MYGPFYNQKVKEFDDSMKFKARIHPLGREAECYVHLLCTATSTINAGMGHLIVKSEKHYSIAAAMVLLVIS